MSTEVDKTGEENEQEETAVSKKAKAASLKTEKERMTASAMRANERELSTKEQLDAMPKVRIRIALPPGVKADSAELKTKHYVTAQINGYTFQINRGVYVEVPEEIANILAEAGYI
jgi:hypothetical protein